MVPHARTSALDALQSQLLGQAHSCPSELLSRETNAGPFLSRLLSALTTCDLHQTIPPAAVIAGAVAT